MPEDLIGWLSNAARSVGHEGRNDAANGSEEEGRPEAGAGESSSPGPPTRFSAKAVTGVEEEAEVATREAGNYPLPNAREMSSSLRA
jgi:hypothetical protein